MILTSFELEHGRGLTCVTKFLCCILAESASRLVTTLVVLMTGSCLVAQAGTLVPLTMPACPTTDVDVSIIISGSAAARCFELTAVLGYGGGGGRMSPPPPGGPPRAGAGDGPGDVGLFGGGRGVRETCGMKEVLLFLY